MVKRILYCVFLLLSFQCIGQQQSQWFSQSPQTAFYSFKCVTDGRTAGDSCDICPTTIIESRSFNGLLVLRDSVPWKWIDQPYSIRVKPGNLVEYWEHGASPYNERLTIELSLTPFTTVQAMADSTFCNGTTPGSYALWYSSDSINTAPIFRSDTVTIVGDAPIHVTLDSISQKYRISIDTTGLGAGGGGSVSSGNAITVSTGVVNWGGSTTGNTIVTGNDSHTISWRKIGGIDINSKTYYLQQNYRRFLHQSGGYGGTTDTLYNTFIGYLAGQNFATGSTGYANTVVGTKAGLVLNGNSSNASSNCIFGAGAGEAITTGSFNSIFGTRAASTQTTASFVTALGYHTLVANTASNNTAVGNQAGTANTSGTITAFGNQSLFKNTTGIRNVGVGDGTLKENVSNNDNTAVGFNAGTNPIGDEQTFVGANSGLGAAGSTATLNTGIGRNSLSSITTAVSNMAAGRSSLERCTSCDDNAALGLNSGNALTTGDRNVFLGRGAGASFPITGSDDIIVGYNISPASDVSNVMMLGRAIYATTQNSLSSSMVGVGTVTPARKLHVEGDVRITDLTTDTPTVLLSADADGDVSSTTVGSGLSLSSGTITNSAPDQVVSITGAGISVVTGSYPNFTITSTEVDGSTTNEIQTYGHSGTTSYTNTLSSGGGSFTLNAGSGITISHTAGTVTISSTGSGDILQNGNTFGTGVVIGTNDNFSTSFETNNVVRLSISSGAATGGDVVFTGITSNTNSVQNRLTVQTNSNGIAASGIGSGVLFQAETSTTDNQDQILLSAIWSNATHAARTSALIYSDVNNAGALTERFRFTPVSMTTAVAYTIGNSGNTVTIGGSTGFVTLSSQATSPAAVQITTSNPTVGGTTFGGNTAYTGTTLNKQKIRVGSDSYAVASGTGTLTGILIDDTYNLTGTASGIKKGVHIKPTLTSLASGSFRGAFFEYDNASAFGVYQSGELTKNYLEGRLTINRTTGGTGTGNAFLNLAGGAITGDADMIRSAANISGEMIVVTANARNIGSSGNVRIEAQVGGTSAGDPYFASVIPGGSTTVWGNDNTDGDKFKITPGGTTPGSTANKGVTITQDAVSLVGINKDVPVEEMDVNGQVRAVHYLNTGNLWNNALCTFGTGAGTGPSIQLLSGGNNFYIFEFTTGTAPAASQRIALLTFPDPFPIGPTISVISARSATTATDLNKIYISSSSDTGLDLFSNGTLAASTQYKLMIMTGGRE